MNTCDLRRVVFKDCSPNTNHSRIESTLLQILLLYPYTRLRILVVGINRLYSCWKEDGVFRLHGGRLIHGVLAWQRTPLALIRSTARSPRINRFFPKDEACAHTSFDGILAGIAAHGSVAKRNRHTECLVARVLNFRRQWPCRGIGAASILSMCHVVNGRDFCLCDILFLGTRLLCAREHFHGNQRSEEYCLYSQYSL